MYSIKTKLILGISVLIVFLFSVAAYLLIDEKKRELSHDIYLNARSFAELTTPRIVTLYETLLKEQSFVLFNRELKDIFRKDEDVAHIAIYSFAGELLFNSRTEMDRAYEGDTRIVEDSALLSRIKANLPSFGLQKGRVVYLKKERDGMYRSVDENEKPILPIADDELIREIVYPTGGKYAIAFEITYGNLQERIAHTTQRIILLLAFGILVGLGFGLVFSRKITTPIVELTHGAAILAKGDFTARVNVNTHDEVGVLAQTFNKMAGDLERSMQAMIYEERVAKELEMAAKIQRQILPTRMPDIPGLDVSAAVAPAAEIGGDCYDLITVDPQTHLFYISDVTGHGVPSGLVVSIANAIIYSQAKAKNLCDILVSTNAVLKEKTSSNMFMTLLMVRYSAGQFSYVSAGHPEMMQYVAASGEVLAVKGGGIALGMVKDIGKLVHEEKLPVAPGDYLVLYSDGIPEAASEKGEMYGAARIKESMVRHAGLQKAEQIRDAIIADVRAFMGSATQLDDITIVVIKTAKA